jgi:hypothetical protein
MLNRPAVNPSEMPNAKIRYGVAETSVSKNAVGRVSVPGRKNAPSIKEV